MLVVHDAISLRQALDLRCGERVALVPTMGNLHAGHLALVALAKARAELVVVSIFVNPLQFGVNEDFAAYPRTLVQDCEQLRAAGVDVVFAPSVKDMYPDANAQGLQQHVIIQPPPFAHLYCGASRPGHFVGVATVVAKLFNLVRPQLAVFGKKDYQQLMVIRALVQSLNFSIEIVAGETMREDSGLAMSSRNGYLSAAQKLAAPQLHQQLQTIRNALHSGMRDYAQLTEAAKLALSSRGWQVDYLAICAPENLAYPGQDAQRWVVLAAAVLGNTRLIDNLEVTV